jgi:hypothetical protein
MNAQPATNGDRAGPWAAMGRSAALYWVGQQRLASKPVRHPVALGFVVPGAAFGVPRKGINEPQIDPEIHS